MQAGFQRLIRHPVSGGFWPFAAIAHLSANDGRSDRAVMREDDKRCFKLEYGFSRLSTGVAPTSCNIAELI